MIVITRQTDYRADGVEAVSSLEDALQIAAAPGDEEVFVIGGAEIYRLALPHADRLYLTRIHTNVEGDACFPEFKLDAWRLSESESHPADENNDHPFTFELYERA